MGLCSITNKLALIEGADFAGHDYLSEFVEDAGFVGTTLNSAIQLTEHAYRMFDTLIDMDYTDAALANRSVNEADVIGIEQKDAPGNSETGANKEAKKSGIFAKIQEIFNAIINAIKQTGNKFIAKIAALVKSDKKIIAKYKPAIQKANFDGWNGISNFSIPEFNSEGRRSQITSDLEAAMDVCKKIDEANDKSTISNALEEGKKTITGGGDSEGKKEDGTKEEKTKENWKPDKNTLIKLVGELENGKTAIQAIRSASNISISKLNNLRAAAKDLQNSSDNELDTAKANAFYTIANLAIRTFSKRYNKYVSEATRYISRVRQAVILAGRYALGQSKGSDKKDEATQESADLTEFMIREASDMYVYEMFDMQ